MYPTSVGSTAFTLFGEFDCSKEQQWDYLKSMTITSDMKVVNEYYCSSSRPTSFEITKEKNGNPAVPFFITEKDESGYMVKIYEVDVTSSNTVLYLRSIVFDYNYFYNKPGSIPSTPTEYMVNIQKQ